MIGGKNDFLGIAYLTFGGISLFMALTLLRYFIKQLECNYPTSDVKEAMPMFGNYNKDHHEVSTIGSSSDGGSCLSQLSN